MSNFKKYTLALLVLVFSGSLSAQAYIEGGVGNANAKYSDDYVDVEGDDTYFRITGGYRHSDALSLEGGYWDLGELQDGIVTASADGLYGAVKGTAKTSDSVNLFGRIGLYSWDSTVCAGGYGCRDDSGSDLFFGGGIGFAAGSGTFNIELNVFSLDDVDVTAIGASYTIPIGKQ